VAEPIPTRLLPPDKWVEKQLGTLEAVGEANYRARVVIPKKLAIAEGIKAQPKYEAQMKKPEVLARRAEKLKAVTEAEWLGYTLEIGAPRLVEGVTKRRKEVEDFVSAWQPILLDHVKKIDVMPEVTDREREERMLANLRGLKALKAKWIKPA